MRDWFLSYFWLEKSMASSRLVIVWMDNVGLESFFCRIEEFLEQRSMLLAETFGGIKEVQTGS